MRDDLAVIRRRRSNPLLISLFSLVVAACGGGSSGSSEPDGGALTTEASGTPSTPATTVDEPSAEADPEAAIAAEVDSFLALDPEEREAQLTELSADVERRLYAVSGLEEAIGGPESTDASISETAAWMASLASEATAALGELTGGPQGFRRAVSGTTDLAAGLFGGILVNSFVTKAAVERSNGGEGGTTELNGIKIDVSADRAETSSDVSFTDKQGVTTTLKTTSKVLPCPGPDGSFTANSTMETASTVGGGTTGKRARIEVTVRGSVDDNAELVDASYEVRGEAADFQQSRGKYVEVTTVVGSGGSGAAVTRRAGPVDQDFVDATATLSSLLGMLVGIELKNAAEAAWKSGRCVDLVTTVSAGPAGLAPGQTVTITAAPRSKVDGAPTGGTVVANLTAGAAAVDPAGTKVPAVATFTYTAPPERDQTGTVALEARSRRGVGKATLDFDTKQTGYTASGGGTDVTISGTIASLDEPFTLTAEFVGGSGTFSYRGDEQGGTVEVAGSGGGATVSGDGTYTIVDAGDGTKTLTQTVGACVDVSGICNTTTQVLTLTPIG